VPLLRHRPAPVHRPQHRLTYRALPSGALRFDPKHIDGWGEPNHGAYETATARIPEEVLGPLFVWAMRFIDEFSADILAADRQWRTPTPPSAEPHTYGQLPVLLQAWLDEHVAAGRPLPAWRGTTRTTAIADALGRNRISLARYRHLIDAAIVGTTPQTVAADPRPARRSAVDRGDPGRPHPNATASPHWPAGRVLPGPGLPLSLDPPVGDRSGMGFVQRGAC
jgi:hypothetical protein